MSRKKLSRRQFVAATALSSAALITAPYVRGAYAAGKLSIGFWDHWVPGANKASTDIVNAWAEKEKVEVQIDYIPSQGNKNLLTIAAEAQAKSGHDILAMPTWWPHAQAELLEPMNDVVEGLIKQNGEPNGTVKYLGQSKGKWLAVPASVGSQIKGPCSRIDLMKQHAGIDVQALYPAGAPPKADSWNLDTFLKAAEACQKGGVPFGIGLGETSDNVDTAGAIFQSYGAALVDEKGNLTVKTDAVRQALEYYKKLISFLPPDVGAWDDCLQQQVAGLRQGRHDHEPAERLGGGQARRPAGSRAVLDSWLPGRTEGPLRALPRLLLGHLVVLQEQGRGQERAPGAFATGCDREDVRGERWLRPPLLRKAHHPEGLAGGRAAEGHALPLSEPAQPPDAFDRRGARPAEDRTADLYAGDPDQDVPALSQGRSHGKGARLG